MNSSSTQTPTPEEPRRRSEHPRVKAGWMALAWLAVIVLAITPFPWW